MGGAVGVRRDESPEAENDLGGAARRAAVVTLVALAIVVAALALWKLRVVIAALFLAFTLAAAMRPGVDWMSRHRVPRALGVLIHYVAGAAALALFLAFLVPVISDQVTTAMATRPASAHSGIEREILLALHKRIDHLPPASRMLRPALSVTKTAFEILIGIVFTLTAAAYWIFERDNAVDLVTSLLPRPRRKVVRDTWALVDLQLGAFVRGELLLVALMATVMSLVFWAIGLPYFLLVGIGAGILEVIPVVGPVIAAIVAIAAGLTVSWHLALAAGVALVVIRVIEDHLVSPRVLGTAVGMRPLVVLVAVTATGILLGGFYVLLAVPIASFAVTLVNVVLRGRDPAEADVPAVLFPAKD
jgi:predicted PurR-regulated permease PerM